MYSYLELENKSFEDFFLKFCGMQECKPNYSYGPAVRPNYLLHYCLSGQGEYHVNNQVYQIKAGDAFLIMPNVVTYYQADQHEPWTYLWISFDGSKTRQYLKRCNLDEHNLVVHCDYINELRETTIAILAHNKLSYSNELFIQGQLYTFFSFLAKSANITYNDNVAPNYNPYVDKAIEYIQNNYQEMVTVNEIADYLSLNRSYLTTLFKKHLHLSPQEFLLKYRMMRAEDLLTNTDLTINQIAFSCGYSNQLSFSKAFSNSHQMAPRDYRKQFKLVDNSRMNDPHKRKE